MRGIQHMFRISIIETRHINFQPSGLTHEVGSTMRLPHIILAMLAVPLVGCATVDLADMTPASSQTEAPAEENVVIRSASAMTEYFTKSGWNVDVGQGKIQAAASFLLRGMKHKEGKAVAPYVVSATSLNAVRADIQDASLHIQKSVKAAEVYLDMSSGEDDLAGELKVLQTALGACHNAQSVFKAALKKNEVKDINAALASLNKDVHDLRDVTNAYGERVRAYTPAASVAS